MFGNIHAHSILSGMNNFPQLIVSVVAVNCLKRPCDLEIIRVVNALIRASLAFVLTASPSLSWRLLASATEEDD